MEEFIEQDIHRVLSGFDGVWRRVTGQSSLPLQSMTHPADVLEGFIRREKQAAVQDATLARCFQGARRSVLLMRSRAAERRLSRLRAEYFLLTGEIYSPHTDRPRVSSGLSALREAALRDAAAAEDYRAAAKRSGQLSELYTCFAEERDASARELRRIILQCF